MSFVTILKGTGHTGTALSRRTRSRQDAVMTAPGSSSAPRPLPPAAAAALGLGHPGCRRRGGRLAASITPGSTVEEHALASLSEALKLAVAEPPDQPRSDRRLRLSDGRLAKLWTGRRRRRALRSLTLAGELEARAIRGPGAIAAAWTPDLGLFVMDDVGGRPIESLARTEGFGGALAHCFAELHRRGVFHGDAKRSNLRVAADATRLTLDHLILLDIDGLRLDPLLSDHAAGKDLGMLLSSLGGFLGADGRAALLDGYLAQRGIGPLRGFAIRRRARTLVDRRAARGSTPAQGGWTGAEP